MVDKLNPIRDTNDEARALARSLIYNATFASIAVLEPDTSHPLVSRIGVGAIKGKANEPFFLASDLSNHSKALMVDNRTSIMLGEPPQKGDPLAFARITIIGTIEKITREHDSYKARHEFWLDKYPKSQLYINFGDFNFYALKVERVLLNGGFGKAFEMLGKDLCD